jgi:hypothetical protein
VQDVTPDELNDLRAYKGFPRVGEELIGVIGLIAAAALMTAWAGQEFPIPDRVSPCAHSRHRVRRRRELAAIIGEDALISLVREWGGQSLYVPSCRNARIQQRQAAIRAEYDRLTMKEAQTHNAAIFTLAQAYEISGRAIEKFLNQPDSPLKGAAA